MTPDEEKRFPLLPETQWQDKVRNCVGLFKQRPLETRKQFAERVFRAFQEYQRKRPPKDQKK